MSNQDSFSQTFVSLKEQSRRFLCLIIDSSSHNELILAVPFWNFRVALGIWVENLSAHSNRDLFVSFPMDYFLVYSDTAEILSKRPKQLPHGGRVGLRGKDLSKLSEHCDGSYWTWLSKWISNSAKFFFHWSNMGRRTFHRTYRQLSPPDQLKTHQTSFSVSVDE